MRRLISVALTIAIAVPLLILWRMHDHSPAKAVHAGSAGVLRLGPDRSPGEAVRASRSRRAPGQATEVHVSAPAHVQSGVRRLVSQRGLDQPTGFQAWRSSSAARAVVQCESGNDNSARSHTGKYRGRWQMDSSFWRTYGGRSFASSPELASERDQDWVAYRGFLDRGWQPWTCARIVGLIP